MTGSTHTAEPIYTQPNPHPVRSNISCNYAGCSATSRIIFNYETDLYPSYEAACPLPVLNLYFWLTDFQILTEYLLISINDKFYGRCDGGADNQLDNIYQCLYNADITEWIFFNGISPDLADDPDGIEWGSTRIKIEINITDNVDSLESNIHGNLLDAYVEFDCIQDVSQSKRIVDQKYIINTTQQRYDMKQHVECQGAGCNASVTFDVVGVCNNPRLTIQFWLSGMFNYLVLTEFEVRTVSTFELF